MKKDSVETGIYIIKCLISDKVYIGKSKNIKKRWKAYKSGRSHNEHLARAITRYGLENFIFEILEICDYSSLDDREVYWISFYESWNPEKGYNRTFGGEGVKPTKEALLNMSKASKGRFPNSVTRHKKSVIQANKKWITNDMEETTINKQQEVPSGWRYGRLPRSKESNIKTSNTCKQVLNTPEMKEKISKTIKAACEKRNCSLSEDTKRKIANKKREYFSKKENREKMSSYRLGKVFITNGVEDKVVNKDTPLEEGWYLGKSKVINITNGKENKRISRNEEIPEGWELGMFNKEQEQAT